MPNRRRRRLSTATSAVAALAVVSPFAITAVLDLSKPAPQPREFQQAAMVTDLPNELMSALSQGLSQFGINLPSMPSSLTGDSTALTAPGGLTAPGALTAPGLTPGLTSPAAAPGLTSPLGTPGLTTPPAATGLPGTTPPLTDPALSSTALLDPAAATGAGAPNPALTSPTGALPGGLTTPPVAGANPALATTPISNAAGLPAPGEVPISAPIGLDPAAGGLGTSYPILGGDSLASSMPASTGSTGLLGNLSSTAQQLGAGQAIDLLKGVVMPMITSAMKPGIPAAPVPVPAPPAPAPAG